MPVLVPVLVLVLVLVLVVITAGSALTVAVRLAASGVQLARTSAAAVLRAVSGLALRRIHDGALIDRDGMELTGAHS
ncbi:hypothetical protein ACGFSB_34780 [Streptomyces sp. NPDC048441]|uniref:hypothetical protein n=1 Tax=Streptomyces sp. NPDC048441 TaxID=3365552 RepID=UPI00371A2F6C